LSPEERIKDLEYYDIKMNNQWQGDTMRYWQRFLRKVVRTVGSLLGYHLCVCKLQIISNPSRLPPTVRLVSARFAKVPMFETFDDELIARITDIVALLASTGYFNPNESK